MALVVDIPRVDIITGHPSEEDDQVATANKKEDLSRSSVPPTTEDFQTLEELLRSTMA